MPRNSERGGPQTRARIREVSNRLFQERGFDSVTVAEVAREAGVSSVTVFNHFPRKEDLFLDRTADVVDLLRAAVRERGEAMDVLDSLHRVAVRLLDERHPFSGVAELSVPFVKTVAESPALVSRTREILSELQRVLAGELERDARFTGDATLFAALFLAGYSSMFVRTALRVMADGAVSVAVVNDQRAALARLFAALRNGLPSGG
jgi:AcrR family transcriptional regulator